MAEEKARDPTKPEIKPVSIPLSKIHDLPGSVFAPPSPKSLEALTSSIVLKGVQEPVILRQREDGEFQIVSGNRRRKASELAKKTEIPAFIYDMTEKEARDFRLRGNAKVMQPAHATVIGSIAVIAVRASVKPSMQPVTAILMEAGRNIPAVSTGAKPIAGTAAIRITNMPVTA